MAGWDALLGRSCYVSTMARNQTPRRPTSSSGFRIGREGFARISAIEGVRLTPAMKRDLESFERDKLPQEARRQAIRTKYGRT
jgi:hypothetical protein